MSCIMCKFAEKSLKCKVVYENDKVLAYEDWNPWAPIHITVFPKSHVGLKDKDTEAFKAAITAVETELPTIIQAAGIAKVLRIVRFETEEHITQNMEHFHYHILGSQDMDFDGTLKN